MIKKFEEFINEAMEVSVESDIIEITEDVWCHILFGMSIDELPDEVESESELISKKKLIKDAAKDFAQQFSVMVEPLGVTVKISSDSKLVTITGVTSENFWEYVGKLGEYEWPNVFYESDLYEFIPESDVDEDELYRTVKKWCAY